LNTILSDGNASRSTAFVGAVDVDALPDPYFAELRTAGARSILTIRSGGFAGPLHRALDGATFTVPGAPANRFFAASTSGGPIDDVNLVRTVDLLPPDLLLLESFSTNTAPAEDLLLEFPLRT